MKLPVEGELFDGKYRIGAVLGVGGMATVLAAKHTGFDEMVALKILLPDCCDDPAVVDRFVQEGKTAIKIRSEHVVRMLDVGNIDGQAYLVMEYLDGKDLQALLRKGGPLPFVTAVDLLLQACQAIGEAHALGIVHRDLKPANLFLTHRADGSPCVKVLDFGISKMPRGASSATDAPCQTLPSMVMGSPQYMSPEQMMSAAAADARSDIWSLGTILYELLTGQLAFDGAVTAEICARVLQGSPVPIEQLRPDVPGELVAIVARCLEKDRDNRYANVAELARALAPFGTSSARASAESIARVLDAGTEDLLPTSEAATIKPTAAEILASGTAARGDARTRSGRKSGYFVATLLSVAVIGLVVTGASRRVGTLHLSWPLAAPPSSAQVVLAVPAVAPLPTVELSAVPAASLVAAKPRRPKPALTGAALPSRGSASSVGEAPVRRTSDDRAIEGDDDAGPYDAP